MARGCQINIERISAIEVTKLGDGTRWRYRLYNHLSTLRVTEGILEETLPGLGVPKKKESVIFFSFLLLRQSDLIEVNRNNGNYFYYFTTAISESIFYTLRRYAVVVAILFV
jgi:hypothetical protein